MVEVAAYWRHEPCALFPFFFIAVSVPCFSAESAAEEMRLRQVKRSSAKASQELTLMEKSFSEAFQVSLKRFLWPPTERLPWTSSRKRSLLWDAVVWQRVDDVTCPSDLCLAHYSVNAACICMYTARVQ